MSNILIIKHGSLGDIVQISGVLQDIRKHYKKDKIYILTSNLYAPLLNKCPYIDEVLIDEKKPRWNFLFLLNLISTIRKHSFSQVIDLQNSSRTEFYRKYLFNIINWSSSYTILQPGETKKQFDQDGVLERFQVQLERTLIQTHHTLIPDFSWAVDKDFSNIINKPYVFLSPFSSNSLPHKRWPYYQELIQLIKKEFFHLEVVVAPGPGEIEKCKDLDARIILDNDKPTNFFQLAKIIQGSKVVVANDTGPAHIAAHLGCQGVVLFGSHTSPKKVSIETNQFKAIISQDLKALTAEMVFQKIKPLLSK
jgi:ADP-heptose:LPS heptosyltransferase